MKKGRIIATCVAFGLILSLMAFGVYAALSTSFSISNKILFTAANDQAYFSAELSTYYKTDDEAQWKGMDPPKTIKTLDTEIEATVDSPSNTITDFNFGTAKYYKITLVVTNKSQSENMKVTIRNLPQSEYFMITPSENMTVIDNGMTELQGAMIAKDASVTIELTYQIVNYAHTFEVNQNLTVEMSIPQVNG